MDHFVKKQQKLIFTILILVLMYMGLAFVAPRITIWNLTSTYHPESCVPTDISEGQSFEYSFPIPYNYINTIDVLFTEESYENPAIIPFEAHLELIAPDGSAVIEKTMTSIFDTTAGSGYTPVSKGATYTLRFNVTRVDAPEDTPLPQIEISSENGVAFDITGRYNGAPGRGTFTALYVLFSIVILLYVYSIDSRSHLVRKISEWLLLLSVSFASILLLSQIFDSEMIIRGALKIIEAVKAGSLFSYYDYSYTGSLIAGNSIESVAHNYDFFLMLPVVILIFPLSFFMNSTDTYNDSFTFAIIMLSFAMLICILICGKLTEKICKACGMPEEYSGTVKRMFVFSPFLLSATIVFGQIDMLYIVFVTAALIMYYKGRYWPFTMLMSVAIAMKTLPIMLFIPLILLVKKKIVPLISYGIGAVSFTLLSTLLFKCGFGYDAIMNVVGIRYDFISNLFVSPIGFKNDLFPICYAFICIYAYMHSETFESKKDLLKTSMTVIFATYVSFVAFTDWHAQWLIPLILSLSFLLPFYKKQNSVMVLAVIAEALLILCSYGGKTWSMYMTNFILPTLTGYTYNGPTLTTVYNTIGSWCFTLISSLCSAVLIALCFYFFKKDPSSASSETNPLPLKTLACLRITVLYAVVIFFLWSYWYIG